MNKTLKVYIPFKQKDILGIRIKCDDFPELELRSLQSNGYGIYSTSTEISLVDDGNISYVYEVKLSGMLFSYKQSSDRCWLDKYEEQRDCFHQQGYYLLYCIAGHIEDIIFRSYSDLKTLTMQIETFLSKKKNTLSLKDCSTMLTILMDEFDRDKNKLSACLISIVIGNIYRIIPNQLEIISLENANYILESLSETQLCNFPSSCLKYLPSVCLTIAKRAFGKTFTLLHFIQLTYSFLGIESLNELLEAEGMDHIFCYDNNDSETSAECVIRDIIMEHACNKEFQIHASNVIRYFIKQLPFRIACHVSEVVRQLLSSLAISSSWTDMVFNQLFVRCSDEFKMVKSCELEAIQTLWEKMTTIGHTRLEIKDQIEQEIVGRVRNTRVSANTRKMLITMCQTHGLFETRETQTVLLEAIASSQDQEINQQFLEILQLDKFENVDEKNEQKSKFYLKWFQTLLFSILQNKQFCTAAPILYKSFFCAIEVAKLSENGKEINLLEKMIISFMKTKGLREVLYHVDKLESICSDPYHLSTCMRHLQMLISEQHSGIKPHDVLDSICTAGELRINSRLTLSIACLLMESFCPTCHQEDAILVFINLLQRHLFWERIFKACGSLAQQLENEEIFTFCRNCIFEVTHLFETHAITFKQFRKMIAVGMGSTKSLLYCNGKKKKKTSQMIDDYNHILQERRHQLEVTHSVLTEICSHVDKDIKNKVTIFVDEVTHLRHRFDDISPTKIQIRHDIWDEINLLMPLCLRLEKVIRSKVFWNLNTNLKEVECVWNDQSDDQQDTYLKDIRYLFGEVSEEVHEHSTTGSFILTFLEHGGKTYGEAWRQIENDPSIKMERVLHMFADSKKVIQMEIHTAEEYIGYKLKEDIRLSLQRLFCIAEVRGNVNAMVKSLEAFHFGISDLDDFNAAVISFYHLLDHDILKLSLAEAIACLKLVFSIEEHLLPPTIRILDSFGKASSLLDFLRSVAEDDMRNLIDAVEDISEQHVTEASVSALIEVKRFCKPLLQAQFQTGFVDFMHAIQRQADSIGQAVNDMPSKIDNCMANLHNLKSLYNNVANRGEQTKQIISNIVRKGKFEFTLCPKLKTCDFVISYRPDKKKGIIKHSKSSINDYRSRALLLMNSDKYKQDSKSAKDTLEKFTVYVDLCIDIANFAYQLHFYGHVDFKTYYRNISFASLESEKKQLKDTFLSWLEKLNSNRQELYIMNFFQGKHIHALDGFLGGNICTDVVSALVQFVHPSMCADEIKTNYKLLMSRNPNYNQLQYIGHAFHQCINGLPQFKRKVLLDEEQKIHVTEVIEDGRLLVARIDENSTLMIRSVLALFMKTTGALPEPSQLLICSMDTTWDEIQLILGRCFGAYNFYGGKTLFCLTNIELLSSEVQLQLMEGLRNIHGRKHFSLAIVCQCQKNHHLMDELGEFIVPFRSMSDESVRTLLRKECPKVCTYTSEVAGLGKTKCIFELAKVSGRTVKTLHVSGPINKRKLVDRLCQLNLEESNYLHIDIGDVDRPGELDKILFELIVLKYVDTDFTSVKLSTDYVAIEIDWKYNK